MDAHLFNSYIVYSAMNVYFIPIGKIFQLSETENGYFQNDYGTTFNNAMIYSMLAEGSSDVVDTVGSSLFQQDERMTKLVDDEIVRRIAAESTLR